MAAFSIPYLRGVASKVADAFGLSVADASRIVGYYSLKGDGVGVSGCENLDITIIKAAADSVGVALPGSDSGRAADADGSKADSIKNEEKDHGGGAAAGASETVKHTEKTQKLTENKPVKENNNDSIINKNKSPKRAKNETVLQNADAVADAVKENNNGIITDAEKETTPGGAGSFAGIVSETSGAILNIDIIDSIINDFADSCRLDEPQKMAGSQWRSCCLMIGAYITKHRLLEDIQKSARHGGKVYNFDKINFCVDLFEFSCGKVKKAPLITDFCAFSGVSSSYLYNTNGRCVVTSGGVDIRKKLQDMQQAGIASGIVNDRENPTGKIYFSKAVLGWSENNNVAPIQEEKSQSVAALPVFGAPDDD